MSNDHLSIHSKASGVDVRVKVLENTDEDDLKCADKYITSEDEYTPAEYKRLVRKIDL